MKTAIRVAIRRFIDHHLVADDPFPERSWLDQQDMSRVEVPAGSAVAGLPVVPLSPLAGRHAGHGQYPHRPRRRPRDHSVARRSERN